MDVTKVCEPKILSKKLFGPFHRYCLYQELTRFGTVVWFVDDAEGPGGSVITIRQADTKEEALRGLDLGNTKLEDM